MATGTRPCEIDDFAPFPPPSLPTSKEQQDWSRAVTKFEEVFSGLRGQNVVYRYICGKSLEGELGPLLIAASRRRKDRVVATLSKGQRTHSEEHHPLLLVLDQWLEHVMMLISRWQPLMNGELDDGNPCLIKSTCFYLTYTIVYGFFSDALASDLKDIETIGVATTQTTQIKVHLVSQLNKLDNTLAEYFLAYIELNHLVREDAEAVKMQTVKLGHGLASLCGKLQLGAYLSDPAQGLMWNSRSVMREWAMDKLKQPAAA